MTHYIRRFSLEDECVTRLNQRDKCLYIFRSVVVLEHSGSTIVIEMRWMENGDATNYHHFCKMLTALMGGCVCAMCVHHR